MPRTHLDHDEAREEEHAEHSDRDLRRLPSLRGTLDERVHDSPEAERERGRAPKSVDWSALGSKDSGTCRAVSTTTTATIGRLMKNTARHETDSISQPPRNGPMAVATPPNPLHAPIAAPRSCTRNDAEMIARLPGTRSAAAAPCTQRATMRVTMFGARPHSSDATRTTRGRS